MSALATVRRGRTAPPLVEIWKLGEPSPQFLSIGNDTRPVAIWLALRRWQPNRLEAALAKGKVSPEREAERRQLATVLHELREQGASWTAIASATGRNPQSLSRVARKYGPGRPFPERGRPAPMPDALVRVQAERARSVRRRAQIVEILK